MIERLRIVYYSFKFKKINPEYHQILLKYSDYYSGLSPTLQKIFLRRVYISAKFIRFRPVEFRKVTREMRVLITSALVQITFGLDKYILKRFKTIYVVPNTYSFAQYPALLGHVDHRNHIITMSWPSVKEGFIIPDDAMNVALHELAHALHGENEKPLLFNRFFEGASFDDFEKQGVTEIYEIRKKRHPYLSDYAGINMNELFAVSMECFFEQPEIFKEKVPKLYKLMSRILKQDPARKSHPLNR